MAKDSIREPMVRRTPGAITSSEWDGLLRRLGHDPRSVSKVTVTGGTIRVTEETHTEHRIEIDD